MIDMSTNLIGLRFFLTHCLSRQLAWSKYSLHGCLSEWIRVRLKSYD